MKSWHVPESKISEPYFSSGCWVEMVGMLGGNFATEPGMLGGIVDAGWKQNIANKYCETLSVNSFHNNIVRHI